MPRNTRLGGVLFTGAAHVRLPPLDTVINRYAELAHDRRTAAFHAEFVDDTRLTFRIRRIRRTAPGVSVPEAMGQRHPAGPSVLTFFFFGDG